MQIKQLIYISHANPEWTGLGRVADTRVRIVAPPRVSISVTLNTKLGPKTSIIGSLVISLFQISMIDMNISFRGLRG